MTCDRRMEPQNLVLMPGFKPGELALKIDRSHPFFFDHPLDHVPGLLLLEAGVQMAQRAAPRHHFVAGIEGCFLQYALFDAPIRLAASVAGAGRLCIRAVQKGLCRAEVKVTTAPLIAPVAPGDTLPPAQLVPAGAAALNKHNPDNVLISAPELAGDRIRAWLLPRRAACLLTDTAAMTHPLCLLEAFMQIQRHLNASRQDQRRMRDILTGVSFQQSAPVEGHDAPLSIEGAREFHEISPSRFARSATIAHGGHAFATCTITTAMAGRAKMTG